VIASVSVSLQDLLDGAAYRSLAKVRVERLRASA